MVLFHQEPLGKPTPNSNDGFRDQLCTVGVSLMNVQVYLS